MRDLIERLEKASGPDRDLDGRISFVFGEPQSFFGEDFPTIDGPDLHFDKGAWSGGGRSFLASRYTASIDAAVALVKRVHGGSWRAGNTPSGRGFAYLGTSQREHEAATPAIALCIALLRAKEARAEE